MVGTITPTSTNYSTYTTASFSVTAGSHTITFVGVDPSGADYSAFLDQVSINSVSPTGPTDPGFEIPSLGSGLSAYQYRSTGSAWSFSGSAGLSGNGSSFTSGNPNAPQGSQVAFIQGTGTISQSVNFPAVGSYLISFTAAQRGNNGTSNEAVQVQVDGTVVGTFTPASSNYSTYTTASFNVASGSHTITFVGVDPSGADYSAFLDQVSINSVSPSGFTDPSFEIPSEGTGSSAYQYRPTGSAWSFSGDAGLSGNGSDFHLGQPQCPAGQPGWLPPGDWLGQPGGGLRGGRLLPDQRQRRPAGQLGTSNEAVQVLVDGTAVSTFTPTSSNYSTYTTASFNVTAGSHTVTFVGVDPSGADYTAFLDQVSIANVSPAFSDPGYENPSQGQAPRPTSIAPRARHGDSAAWRAWPATAATSPQATPTRRRAARSPSFRGPARSARWWISRRPAPTRSTSAPLSGPTSVPVTSRSRCW